DLDFKVYNRFGQLVFHTADWTIKWDGTIKNIPQDTGIYGWVLTYTDTDTGKRIFRKGVTTLLR
ncbi:MAG TPA: gliding motility-associated C-terminal domain-containing protein, partial [Chitinophagaceae bacterium]|nr:gliding motility-associated C-terminal domain-containing protein [Chitinophagaceae bacterium]